MAAATVSICQPCGTSGSASCYLYGTDFTAENLTFENSAGPVGQAVALWVAGDRMRFKNCRFLGFQDTLYTYGYGSRQLYEDCYIEGTTDFIFGASTAVFDRCEIHSKRDSYITASSTTPPAGHAPKPASSWRPCTASPTPSTQP